MLHALGVIGRAEDGDAVIRRMAEGFEAFVALLAWEEDVVSWDES